MKWFETTASKYFIEKPIQKESCESTNQLEILNTIKQPIKGFGGCFNELGYIALEGLENEKRREIFEALFTDKGLNFNFCRIPIGASDYAQKWYSHNEVENDYDMEHFSIERDYQYLLPFIKEAQACHKDLSFFASPWSPPIWMKTFQSYNYGTLRMEPEVLKAYTLYFEKFIRAYQKEGIQIEQLHIQNEPFADQKFPSCKWSADEFLIFIRDYLGPHFEKLNLETELFLGTLNGPEEMNFSSTGITLDNYNQYLDTILFDEKARSYIKGVGYQWAGRNAIPKTYESFPELTYIQTENECGDGNNTWEYASYMFNLMRHYFKHGVSAYTYWNMVLKPGGKSTWGWSQNTLITVNDKTGEIIYNPEYYVMKHYSHFIQQGAVRLETKGHWNSVASAFLNPDGTQIIVIQNALTREEKITIKNREHTDTFLLPPNSFHTFVIS